MQASLDSQDFRKDGTGAADSAVRLPLSALLSQALVAFTIEFDNEFERQMPHRTAKTKLATDSRELPWLVSLVMWSNYMRFVDTEGVSVRKLVERTHLPAANLRIWLTRLEEWWGYIEVDPVPASMRSGPRFLDRVVRPTPGGRRAQEVWRPLFETIEQRWCVRFGNDAIRSLRESLLALVSRFDAELPQYLPILGYGLRAHFVSIPERAVGSHIEAELSQLSLSALLANVLLAFTLDFENETDLSLALSANVLRILNEEGVLVRDMPRLSGVSKEGINMAVGFLKKRGDVVEALDPSAGNAKVLRLTASGRMARHAYYRTIETVEQRWQAEFGPEVLHNLRESLETLTGEPSGLLSPLFLGLEPYPDGWRASIRKPETLPHYPMVLHRGGFPDGA